MKLVLARPVLQVRLGTCLSLQASSARDTDFAHYQILANPKRSCGVIETWAP